ncbi:MAG: aspartate-semialdehyde dehydrogenase [Candidatus Delongbacteria bacterium]|nr:aspartate-semialdehyde dehydrogenase [Candidatus Delongbacteria bacterium]
MTLSSPHPRIPVGILGATGSVGQKFIELLSRHPWFEIKALGASERSAGKPYREAANWFMSSPLPQEIGHMTVLPCRAKDFPCRLVFSGLDASVAGEVEEEFAQAGCIVISNSRNHRFDPWVPLLIPEVNPDHLDSTRFQPYNGGMIVTNPNCSTIGLAMALKPLDDQFGLDLVQVVTMQAISGAGYPGVPSLDIIDNVIPLIKGEEEKMETEPLKILGKLQKDGTIRQSNFKISAHCNRVAVIDGHTESVTVKLKTKADPPQIIKAWREFRSQAQILNLPTAPLQPIYYHEQENYPQPRLLRNLDKGMAVSIGRLRPCPIMDYKFTLLSHNTVRGAAGGAILNAELLVKKGLAPALNLTPDSLT